MILRTGATGGSLSARETRSAGTLQVPSGSAGLRLSPDRLKSGLVRSFRYYN